VPDDGIAAPISFDARYGEGVDRALVLGGGGVVFVAWLTAYLTELTARGVAVADADRVVGTSAGSVLATVIAAGRLERFSRLIRVVEARPNLIGRLAPAATLTASQQRALALFDHAADAEPAVIRAIGAAALAARTPGVNRLPSSVVPVGDRRAMDGGVSGTGIHSDLVAGARRALVFPIVGDVPEGRMTMTPGGTDREIAALRASGTEVAVRHSRLPLTTNLMDPAEVPAALALGAQQAAEDAPALAAFWSGS
jgi:NTE family protein